MTWCRSKVAVCAIASSRSRASSAEKLYRSRIFIEASRSCVAPRVACSNTNCILESDFEELVVLGGSDNDLDAGVEVPGQHLVCDDRSQLINRPGLSWSIICKLGPLLIARQTSAVELAGSLLSSASITGAPLPGRPAYNGAVIGPPPPWLVATAGSLLSIASIAGAVKAACTPIFRNASRRAGSSTVPSATFASGCGGDQSGSSLIAATPIWCSRAASKRIPAKSRTGF